MFTRLISKMNGRNRKNKRKTKIPVRKEIKIESSSSESDFLSKDLTHFKEIPNFKEIPKVMWVKIEPFEYGCLSVNPCGKLSIQMLKKVMVYTQQNKFFPRLTLKNWIHICTYKLKLNPDWGWIYIRLFDVMYQQMFHRETETKLGTWDSKCEEIRQTRMDKTREFSVPTLEFMLFLYIQHSYRIMGKTKKKNEIAIRAIDNSEEIEYPAEWLYLPKLDEKYIIGEVEQYYYVKDHLEDIIDFLQLFDNSTSTISKNIVMALNLIIGGTLKPQKGAEISKLEQFFFLEDETENTDSDILESKDNTVNRKLFVEYILDKLKYNPVGSGRCFLNSSNEIIKTGVWENTFGVHLNRTGSNDNEPPHKLFTISQVNEQVLCKCNLAPYTNLKIYRCNNTYIYATGVFNYVTIEKCYNTIVYLGCVAKVLRFADCTESYFIGMGRQVIIHDSVTCQFNLHTPTPILLSGQHTTDLIFGPYSTYYPKLAEHMAMVNLGVEPSFWSCVQGVAEPDGSPMETAHRWKPLEEDNYYEFIFPFQMTGKTKCNPIDVPPVYLEYKRILKLDFHDWKQSVEAASLDPTSQQIVHESMYERFKDFLETHEHDFELDGLKTVLYDKMEIKQSIWPLPDLSGDESGSTASPRSSSDEVYDETSSEIESSSEDEEGSDGFSDIDEKVCSSEFMRDRIAELVTRPLSVEFDASGVGINEVGLDFFYHDNSTPPSST